MVSVIIPCYNYGNYLLDAIKSIEYQSYNDYEIIIVDDGSEDKLTIDNLSYLSNKEYSVIFQHNQGPSSARNNGI